MAFGLFLLFQLSNYRVEVARLLLLPLTLLRRAAKKLCKTAKKVFLFFHLYGKI